MQSLGEKHFNVELKIGYADVNQKMVDDAKNFLAEHLSSSYACLIEHLNSISQIPYARSEYLNFTHSIKKTDCKELSGFQGGQMSIPFYLKEQQMLSAEKVHYFAELSFKLKKLQITPLSALLKALVEKISSCGFAASTCTLRFENGCFDSRVDFWHMDYGNDASANAISTSYSTIDNWATRVLNQEHSKRLSHLLSKGFFSCDAQNVAEAESLSSAGEPGCLYNVTKLLHRAPQKSDLLRQVSLDDYRLFIRFNTTAQGAD